MPQPILFQLGFVQIHWYGLFVVFGVVAGLAVVLQLAKYWEIKDDEVYPPTFFQNRQAKQTKDDEHKKLLSLQEPLIESGGVYNLAFYLIIFSFLGARIYAIFLDWPYYFSNPWEIPAVWHGGLAIHGAIIAGIITLLIYTHPLTTHPLTLRCLKLNTPHPLTLTLSPKGERGSLRVGGGQKNSFWLWADLLAVALPLGQAIGRWGNYFNQEIFGKPTALPWGIPIELANRPAGYLNYQYFQPTFLYESGLDLVNFLILLVLFFWLYKKQQAGGLVSLVYLINYSLIRLAMEFLRIDQTPEIFGVRLPVLVSLGIIIVSLSLIIHRLKPKT
jgi:phosphatidylglycerol:prolipoprotein diacylglycerol transferase